MITIRYINDTLIDNQGFFHNWPTSKFIFPNFSIISPSNDSTTLNGKFCKMSYLASCLHQDSLFVFIHHGVHLHSLNHCWAVLRNEVI